MRDTKKFGVAFTLVESSEIPSFVGAKSSGRK